MGFTNKVSLISFIFLSIQSSTLILNAKNLPNGKVKFENISATEELTIIPRQDENTDIREYENIPRVVASVSKIFKGVVSGNVHDIFHGAFSFAPVDVSKRLISVYNQVVGFPLKTTTTEEPTESTVKSNSTKIVIATKGNNSTEVLSELSESQELPEDEEDDEDDEYEDEEFKRRNLDKTKAPPPVTEAVVQTTSPK